jgi:uncharacterized protein YbjT (DUF2867 family)
MKMERAQQKQTTLVLGGTGKTGRRVAQRLKARGVPTRVGSRSGEPPFDWEDEATWAPALRDVESVYVSYTVPDVAVPGAVEAVGSFAELAVESEVRRLVLISGRGEEEAQRAEQDVKAEYVWLLTYLFSEVLDGRNAYLTDGVQRALGREPKDFAVYAREVAATGIWDGGR